MAKKRKPKARAAKAEPRPAKPIIPEPAELDAAAELALHTFVAYAWRIVVPGEPFQDNWHVGAICEHLEALYRREFTDLLINIPPRYGKSTICAVMFPAWLWMKEPAFRMMFASYSQDYTLRDSRLTRHLITSPWYQRRWGDRFAISTDIDQQRRFENDKTGFRIATSPGGIGTGEGADLLAVDDPHNATEVTSELMRQAVLDWYNITMQTRTGRFGRTLRLVVMQRLHEADLAGDILERGGYTHLCLPQEYEKGASKSPWPGWTDQRKEEGELLWPKRFDADYIKKNQRPPRMSSVVYAGQYQQRPAPAEGGMFDRNWWQFYKVAPESLIEGADDGCWSWDMAFKDLKTSDFVAGTGWVRRGANLYLLPHTVHEQMGFSASKMAVKACKAKWPELHAILVEDAANGPAVVNDLKDTVPGMVPVPPEGGKEARASVMQPYVEARNVWLPDPSIAPWVEDYIQEFINFPNGKHDDWVDSSSQAVIWLVHRMLRSFAPISFAWSKDITQQARHQNDVIDKRYGDEPLRSDRGDERPEDRSHDMMDEEHRKECRKCRKDWRERE